VASQCRWCSNGGGESSRSRQQVTKCGSVCRECRQVYPGKQVSQAVAVWHAGRNGMAVLVKVVP